MRFEPLPSSAISFPYLQQRKRLVLMFAGSLKTVEDLGGKRADPDGVAGVVDGGRPVGSNRRERGVEGGEVSVDIGDDRDPHQQSVPPR